MKVVVISDLHFDDNTDWKDITEKMLNRIDKITKDREKVIFVFLGDIINGYKGRTKNDVRRFYEKAGEFLLYIKERINNVDLYSVPGNHDLYNESLEMFNMFNNTYSRIDGDTYDFGREESVFSLLIEDINFIFVDSTLTRNYDDKGRIDLELLQKHVFLNNKNIIFMHHPPCKQETIDGSDDKSISNSNELISTRSKFIFYGHQHGFHKVLDYFKEDTDIHAVGAFLKNATGVKRDFILLDIENGNFKNAYRYDYNGTQFSKKLLFPKKDNIRSIDLILDEPTSLDFEVNIDREYQVEENNFITTPCNIEYIIRNYKNILITGAAGVGKSYTLKKIYYKLKDDSDYYPIWIDLKNINLNYLRKQLDYGRNNTIDNKNFLFLIDGVSELSGQTYTDIITELSTISRGDKTIKIIASAREARNISIDNYTKCRLLPFNTENIIEYAKKSKIDNTNEFISCINENAYMSIADNPFYLKDIVSIFKRDKTLPPIASFMEELIRNRFIDSNSKNNVEYEKSIMANEHILNYSFKELSFVMQVGKKDFLENKYYSQMFNPALQKKQMDTGLLGYNKKNYDRFLSMICFVNTILLISFLISRLKSY